jgi:protein-tyrosine-phosphatase/predicted ATP-grasp superfamily ATP-dependent carboligase
MRIILLGSNERAGYSIAKSLSEKKHTVHIINDKAHALKHSKFVSSFFVTRYSFEKETEPAVAELTAFLKNNYYDILIPVHDTALTVCFHFNAEISKHVKIAFVNSPGVHKYCNDKSALLKLCKKLEIPTPVSLLINRLEDLKNPEEIEYPCIAKPVSSKVFKNGKIFSYTVKKIYSYPELVDFLREKVETVPVMVQQILPKGFGAGYNFLSVNGTVMQSYAHARINEAWGGGQSTYRKTIDPGLFNLKTIAEKIIESAGWTGIAMLEFLIADDTPYVMEINGRAWGSIELGVFAGCDLPADMIKVLFEDAPVNRYRYSSPVYARNLFNEIIWILKAKSPKKLLKWLVSLKDNFRKDHIVEDAFFRDFKFRSAFILDLAGHFLKNVFWGFYTKLSFARIKTFNDTTTLKDKQVAFICKGNINRSAFAEWYTDQKFPGFKISSYGTVFEEDRLSPVNAVTTASKFGIDLGEHRSRYLTEAAIEQTDLFFIMDKSNYWDLRKRKVPKEKIFRLDHNDIKDPYSKDLQYFEMNFSSIATALTRLFGSAQ